MRVTIHSGFTGGVLPAPPSKSMAHRALLCAALASGESKISGICQSDDMLASMRAMRALGAHITYDAAAQCAQVRGIGAGASSLFPPVLQPVDCGESGSTLRFIVPLFSLIGAPVTLTGHGRLLHRPQTVYADLFAAHGLPFTQTPAGITLCGPLPCGEYAIDGSVSSQFISGLLFALPLLLGDSVLRIAPPFESRSYVALTLCAMADFGVTATWLDEFTISIKGSQKYKPCNYAVEGDCSQAAFFAVLAACLSSQGGAGGSTAAAGAVTLTNLRANTLQGDHVIFDILQRCGAQLSHGADGSVTVLPSREKLCATDIDLANCPDLGPALMVLGLFCKGETVLRNAARLRIKESDRIAAMQCEAHKLGGVITAQGDTVRVRGSVLHASNALEGHGDHRIVMALCTAAVAAGFAAPCTMSGAHAVAKSYPAFFTDIAALGAKLEIDTAETAGENDGTA